MDLSKSKQKKDFFFAGPYWRN